MKYLFFVLLLFVFVFPFPVSAKCVPSSAVCTSIFPPSDLARPTYCYDGTTRYCCDNLSLGLPIPDSCPVGGNTPTPRPSCGYNRMPCCMGPYCRTSTDTCYYMEDIGSFCLSRAQIDDWEKKTEAEKDKVNLWCGAPGNYGIRTAIGCIPTQPRQLVALIVSWAAGLGAGATLVIIFLSGLTLTTAAGDVKKVNAAKTSLTAAVVGLAIIILAVIILNFIGVSVFGLNRFGFKV